MQGTSDLFLLERQAEIRRRLGEGRVIAADLATEFRVSEDTIRRDLRELAAEGACIRVYGGALPAPEKAPDLPLADRYGANLDSKRRLAAAMSDFVEPGMTVFLDAGSTNLAAAQLLPDDLDLTVATHAPHIAAVIMDRPGIRLYMIGGKVDAKVGAAVGAQALHQLQSLRPDIAFVGACAIDGAAGVSAFDADDAAFKQLLVHQSRVKLAAAVNDKAGTVAPYPVAPVTAFDSIIVEKTLHPAKRAALDFAQAVLVNA